MNYLQNPNFAPKLFTWEYLKEIRNPRQILLTVGTHVNPHSPALYVGQEGIATAKGIVNPLAVIALPDPSSTPRCARIYYEKGIIDTFLVEYSHFLSGEEDIIAQLSELMAGL